MWLCSSNKYNKGFYGENASLFWLSLGILSPFFGTINNLELEWVTGYKFVEVFVKGRREEGMTCNRGLLFFSIIKDYPS